jgi:protein-tyrosine phosphatase
VIPLVDIHCHLLAGLDDGPKREADALLMCRMAASEGVAVVVALAHQLGRWNTVTVDQIRQGARQLAQTVRLAGVPLTIVPGAEVMVQPEIELAWRQSQVLTVADRRQFLMVEMPHGVCVDLEQVVPALVEAGVRPILAHPERHPELLHGRGRIEQIIQAGCLIQVSSGSVTDPASRRDARALKSWLRRGIVHLVGSDGHSPSTRPPRMAAAYHRIGRWAGRIVADRVCSTNGMAMVQGLPLKVPEPKPASRRWFPWR